MSGNGQWIGILREDGGGLSAGWIANDWVNHPGGSGASGWDLKQGDQFIVADIDGDTRDEVVVVSPNGQWVGVLHEDNGGLSAGWIKNDWVNHPGGSGASGWDLRQGDRFYVADIDGDSRDELVVISPDVQWIGVLQEAGGGLEATWLANDWVNHPGGSGANGWDLKLGDRFFVADVDADNHQEVLVSSPNGRWLGLLRDSGAGLAATWIEADWVEPPGGAAGALLAGGILSAAAESPAGDTADVRLHEPDADAGPQLAEQHRPALYRDDPSRLRPGGREGRPLHRDQRLRRHGRPHGDDRGVL